MDENVSIRTIERWGLLAGVTGVVGNLLLVALYTLALPGVGDFDWTGPANDVMSGVVSTGATIPVALALSSLIRRSAVRVVTFAVVVVLAVGVVASVLLVAGVIAFETQVVIAIPAIVLIFGWTAVIGYAGARRRVLSRPLANWATAMGVAGVAGLLVAAPSLLLPSGSVAQYAVGGAGLVIGVPAYLAFPIWLIALSSRIRASRPVDQDGSPQPDDPEAAEPVVDRRVS